MTDAIHPYLGLFPYQSTDRHLFYGRTAEIRSLKSLLVAHPVVLMHAQSGIGKTSLINAGLIPALEEERVEVFPPVRVRGGIPEGMAPEQIGNLYMLNAILGWMEQDAVQPVRLAHLTLVEFLQPREHRLDEDGLPTLRVVIFDQLEELFTLYPERWQEREDFFRQIAQALEKDPLLRVLMVMREDYLAGLDPYRAILPEMLTRFRLEALREKAALEAVIGPLTGSERSFGPGVAEELVRNLLKSKVETATGVVDVITGEFVEPVQLQVVCRRLWEGLSPEVTTITHKHLEDLGDVDRALQTFYDESIRETARASGVSEAELREWVDTKLITPGGTRGAVWQGEGISAAAVNKMEDLHLIRGDWRTGARWYELIHDRFIDPIRKSNLLWFSQRWEKIQIGRRLEASSAVWGSQGRGKSGLLEEVELLKAESWRGSLTAEDKGCSEQVLSFIEASRAAVEAERVRLEEERRKELEKAQLLAAQVARTEEEERSKRHARIFSAALAVLCVFAVGAALYAYKTREVLNRQFRANDLVRVASVNLGADPDLSLLLVLQAMMTTYARGEGITDYAKLTARRVMQVMPVDTMSLAGVSAPESGAYTADGRLLAIAGHDKTMHIWNLESGKEYPPLNVQSVVQAVAFSGDGLFVATAGRDKMVRIWEVATGQAVTTLAHQGMINALAFSFDGTLIATASGLDTVIIWDVKSSKPRLSLPQRSSQRSLVRDVTFSRDSKRLATAAEDGSARIWNTDTGAPVTRALKEGSSPLLRVLFSPDGGQLATASGDVERVARLWNLATGERTQIFTGHTEAVDRLAFSPDGRHLATASTDRLHGTVKLWDARSGSELRPPMSYYRPVLALAFDSSGRRLLTASADQTAKTWAIPVQKSTGEDRIYGVAYSPDGRYVATANSRGTATLWDSRSKEPVRIFANHTDYVFGVSFSPNGNMLATASWDNTVKLWNTRTGEEQNIRIAHQDMVLQAVFSPDGTRVATASADGTARVWDAATGKELQVLRNPRGEVYRVAFSPDGKRLAVVGQGLAELWDTATFTHPVKLQTKGAGLFRCVAFSRDSRLVAVGDDKVIRIFHADSGKSRSTITGHTGTVWDLAFSPTDDYLASASWDKTARIWVVHTGRELMPLQEHSERVYGVAFSPSGEYLASGSRDGTLHINVINPDRLLNTVRSRINRPFTNAECGLYLSGEGLFARVRTFLSALGARWGWERLSKYKEACPASARALYLLASGNHLARHGDFRQAAAQFARAKKIDPSLSFDPDTKAREIAAEPIKARANLLSHQGKQKEALELYSKANDIDFSHKIDPEPMVRMAAVTRLLSGRGEAAAGNIEPQRGGGKVQRTPELDQDSAMADRIVALQLAVEAKEQGRSGAVSDVANKLRQAKKLYPALSIDPQREQARFEAMYQVRQADWLVREGKVPEAVAQYRKAEDLFQPDHLPAASWNGLCWAATLSGGAGNRYVRQACENAVVYGHGNLAYRDSRALNRAINGDAKGALEDFAACIDLFPEGPEKQRRKAWISRLRAGRPVMDQRELEELQEQE